MLHRYFYVWARQRFVRRFLRACDRTPEVQRELLLEKIRRNADSDFGREHGLDKVRSIEDFRRQVPIATYEYYRPWVERVKAGDIRAMFGPSTELLMFAMTSGTTNASKFIPITADFMKEYRKSWNIWGLKTFWDHKDLLKKKTMQISSDWQQYKTEGGIWCGNISGLAAETRPRVSRPIFIIPTCLNKISDPASKQYTALRVALPSRKIGIMITANPLTLIGMARLADAQREMLIKDIFDGTLSDEVVVAPEVRKQLRSVLKADKTRARELEKIVDQHGNLYPRYFWPELSVVAVWTGGTVGVYLPQVREYYGDVTFRDHGLSASEGRMTTPLTDSSSAGILDVVTHYFEFIPEEEHGSPNATVLGAHELEEGKNYFIVLTTSSGIYRHDIHDVVRCMGYQGKSPLLDFLNKGAHYSSMTGEKLSEFQVVSSVQAAYQELGLPLDQFTLAPVMGDPPGYELLLEDVPAGADERQICHKVDEQLARANCEYENRLETGRLKTMRIKRVPGGTWTQLREQRISKLGASLEQYKHPYLTNKVDFLDTIVGAPAPDSDSTQVETARST